MADSRRYSRRAALAAAGCLIVSPAARPRAQLLAARGQFIELRSASEPPTTQIERIDGKLVELGEFRGKVVLVNFWATWCPPCRRELAQLDKLRRDAPSSLEIVAIAIDDAGRSVVEPFLKRRDIRHLRPYLDPKRRLARRVGEDTATPFVLYAMPISYVIGRRGLIAGYLAGEADWTSAEGSSILERFLAD